MQTGRSTEPAEPARELVAPVASARAPAEPDGSAGEPVEPGREHEQTVA
jgi:hypothetical protein